LDILIFPPVTGNDVGKQKNTVMTIAHTIVIALTTYPTTFGSLNGRVGGRNVLERRRTRRRAAGTAKDICATMTVDPMKALKAVSGVSSCRRLL
jgi:hypothetical protein